MRRVCPECGMPTFFYHAASGFAPGECPSFITECRHIVTRDQVMQSMPFDYSDFEVGLKAYLAEPLMPKFDNSFAVEY